MRRTIRPVQALLFLAASTTAAHAAQRVYVASTGVDSAPCTLTQPCRSFAAAHASVDAGGEIVALDAAGYGAVSITKAVTITANPGVFAGIAAATGDAVLVNAPGAEVSLRGLQFNGTGAQTGILVNNVGRLDIDNCVFSNFAGANIQSSGSGRIVMTNSISKSAATAGLLVSGSVTAVVANSQFIGNGSAGIYAQIAARVAITDSLIAANLYGIIVDGGSQVSATRILATNNNESGVATTGGLMIVGYSQVSYNGKYGFFNSSGTIGTLGNNQVVGNALGQSDGPITPLPQF